MAASDIDAYLAGVDEPKRSTLEELRRRILAVSPDAEQTISYTVPAFAVGGKVVAGFAAFKNHLAYLPHSGSVIGQVTGTDAYTSTRGSLHFAIDEPLPQELVTALVEAKLRMLGLE